MGRTFVQCSQLPELFFLVTQILECTSGEVRLSAHNPITTTSACGSLEYYHFSIVFNRVINVLSELVHEIAFYVLCVTFNDILGPELFLQKWVSSYEVLVAKLYFYIPFSNITGIIKACTCFYLEYFRVTENGLKRRQVAMNSVTRALSVSQVDRMDWQVKGRQEQ